MFFDYEILKLIWWLFVGVLLIGFALTDGFDLGIGTLLPFIGKTDEQRRVIINVIGPTWDGNQVWLITAGGALFAAWPLVYAAAFSGFYVALLLVLFALFFRPVGFEYRAKVPSEKWRQFWDWGLFIGGSVPALIIGVAFGNLLQGVPFHFDNDLRFFYTGTFWGLLNPFALLCGVVCVAMLTMHGASYLQFRTRDLIQQRAQRAGRMSALITLVSFILGGVWVSFALRGYVITQQPDVATAFTPLQKAVSVTEGGWLHNFTQYPLLWLAPLAGVVGAVLNLILCQAGRPGLGFIFSGLSVTGIILTAGLAMFPFIMPSSSQPDHSLTLWDSVSSHRTLELMFYATVLFLPIIIAYTSWVYRVMRGPVTEQSVEENKHMMY